MKKILLISYYFNPPYCFGGGRRMEFIRRYLSGKGIETDIISSGYININGNETIIKESISLNNLKRKWKFIRKFNPLPDAMFIWSLRAAKKAMKIHKKYDYIIISSPPPSIIMAFLIKMHIRAKVIVDIRDSWYNGPHQEYGTFINRFIDKLMEEKCINEFNKIIAATKTISERIENRYNKNVLTIYNMLDKNEAINISLKSKEKTLFYGGKIDRVRYNEKFFNVLKGEKNITLRFAGIDEYGISEFGNVEYINTINRRDFLDEMSLCDVSLITINYYIKNPQEIFTSKIFDIILARKKVLYIGPKCELSEFINREKIGIAVTDNNIESIKEGLNNIFINEYSTNDELIERFHFENVLSKNFLLF
ncbi:glycosyltransferase [candidate division WOR-3 bacterium]|nr:glycosyltransferase [candidate division WOR-3 bacterium]